MKPGNQAKAQVLIPAVGMTVRLAHAEAASFSMQFFCLQIIRFTPVE